MASMAIQPGTKLDTFEIVEAIGHGAFSDVYLALDPTGRKVVLKCPHDAIMGDATTFDRFRRELEIAKRLDHPGIQHSYDLGAHRSRPYLVMEYVDGETLRDLLHREKRLPTARAIDLTEQLAGAMAYAHSQGVFHRDLKPENILITAEGHLVVTDFGIALLSGAKRLTWRFLTSAVGTPDYMAPEQIQGKRGVMQQHLSAPLPDLHKINSSVLPPLEAIIRKCLRKNPDERYQDAGELLYDLKHWQDLDLSGFNFAPEGSLTQPSEKGLWLIVAALSVGFLAAASVATYLYYLLSHAGH